MGEQTEQTVCLIFKGAGFSVPLPTYDFPNLFKLSNLHLSQGGHWKLGEFKSFSARTL